MMLRVLFGKGDTREDAVALFKLLCHIDYDWAGCVNDCEKCAYKKARKAVEKATMYLSEQYKTSGF